MAPLGAVAAGLVLAAAVAACGSEPRATEPPVTPSNPPTAVPTPVPTALPTSDAAVGRPAIRVDTIQPEAGIVRFTEAMVFVDEEATEAAIEDGHAWGAPNPIWIRDLPTTGALPVDPAATVTLLGFDALGTRVAKRVDAATFERVFSGGAPPNAWDHTPYLYVEVEDGRIVSIEQVETP